jgi:hypothetical protein
MTRWTEEEAIKKVIEQVDSSEAQRDCEQHTCFRDTTRSSCQAIPHPLELAHC